MGTKENNNNSYVNSYLIDEFEKLGKSQKEIIKDLGKSQPYVSALMSGKKQVGRDVAKVLSDLYGFDELSILKGVSAVKLGDITNTGGNVVAGNVGNVNVTKSQAKEIDPNDVINYEVGVPYHNVDFINGFTGVEDITHNNPEYYINYPPANHCEFWVNATGESMKGVIDNGDKIALKQVDTEWFPLGEVYAIITTNGHRMVKKIAKSDDKECYKLISANPNKEEYPDQDIPKKMILTLFKVVTAIKFIN